MADYAYFPGDGVSRLDKTTPVGQSEPGPVLDEATRQIKSYLNDNEEGPDKLLSDLLSAINAYTVPANNAPTGMVVAFTGPSVPSGYLACNGQSVANADYPALYAAIGFTYGGAGAYFTLPDLRGTAPVGFDPTNAKFDALAKVYGSPTHTLTIAEMASHTVSSPNNYNYSNHTQGGGPGNSYAYFSSGSKNLSTSSTVALYSGGDKAHNNTQMSLALNFYIKT